MLDHVLQGMKTVVIGGSGGSGGFGLADARGLQAAGDAVAIRGRNQEKLEKAEANLRRRKLRMCAFRVNVTDGEQFQEPILRIVQEFSLVNMNVNSRANTGSRPIVDIICVRLAAGQLYAMPPAARPPREAAPKGRFRSRGNWPRPPSTLHGPAQASPPTLSSMAMADLLRRAVQTKRTEERDAGTA
jgi:NAD(P)-dependent dehydrogenase (short-subunit alcohol dehydrogenase family)